MSPRPVPSPRDPGATSAGGLVVTARSAGDVVAAVPYVMGFVPANSLVLISLRGPRLRFGVMARTDLAADHRIAELVAADAARQLLRDDPREVIALVYDHGPWRAAQPPHRAVVDVVHDVLAAVGVRLREAVYVTPDWYWSYTCSRSSCCPAEGRPVAAVANSPVAAAYVLEGRSPLRSRAEMAALVEPVPGPRPRSVARLAAGTGASSGRRTAGDRAPELAWQRTTVRELGTVVRRYENRGEPVSDEEAARLLVLLRDDDARDVVMTRWTRWWEAMDHPPTQLPERLRRLLAETTEPAETIEPDPADPAVRAAVEGLLLGLCSLATGRLAPAPLVLLACHAWANGEGALAGVAVERALAVDPHHRMGLLVDVLLRSGLPPRWVAELREDDQARPA